MPMRRTLRSGLGTVCRTGPVTSRVTRWWQRWTRSASTARSSFPPFPCTATTPAMRWRCNGPIPTGSRSSSRSTRTIREWPMSSPTDRREQRIARFRVGDAQRALAAAKGIVALAGIAFHALEERQDLCVAPAPVAQLRPGIEVLGLAADKHHSVNRAGTAEQFAARHREPAAVGARLRLGGIEPVGCGIGDQPGHPDRNERPGMAGPTGLDQQHRVARVCRQPVRDGRTGRTGADNNVIVGLHLLMLPAPAGRKGSQTRLEAITLLKSSRPSCPPRPRYPPVRHYAGLEG